MTHPGTDAAAAEPPLLAAGDALFLDFDGTLAHLAPRPDLVSVDPELVRQLTALSARLQHAVAVVTGRRLRDVDAYLAPLKLPGAGLHGAELRNPDGKREPVPPAPHVRDAAADLHRRFEGVAGVLVEDKALAVALHYRNAPERARECRAAVREVAARHGLRALNGKMVAEARLPGSDKGSAIAALLRARPFRDRRPVFVGDDVTDEDGFGAVGRLGGVGIKVGGGDTRAGFRLADVDAVHGWLDRCLAALGRGAAA